MNKIVIIFPVKCQPFSKYNYSIYKWIISKFKDSDVHLMTSNKVELPNSPLSFEEKKIIVSKLYGIKNITNVKNQFSPNEITNQYSEVNTSVIFMLGKKDCEKFERIRNTYSEDGLPIFLKWENVPQYGYDEHMYYMQIPNFKGEVEDIKFNDVLLKLSNSELPINKKKEIFIKVFGRFNQEVFDMLCKKLSIVKESLSTFLKKYDLGSILNSELDYNYTDSDLKIGTFIMDVLHADEYISKGYSKVMLSEIIKNTMTIFKLEESYKTSINLDMGIIAKKIGHSYNTFLKYEHRIIKESPDTVNLPNGDILKFDDPKSYPFGYLGSGLHIGKEGTYHVQEFEDEEGNIKVSRRMFKYPGRIWLEGKIISFWQYPLDKNKLKDIIKELEKQLKIRIYNNGYKIEIVNELVPEFLYNRSEYNTMDSTLIPLEDYTSSKDRNINTQHTSSPAQKTNVKVPQGFGSKGKLNGALPNETAAETRARLNQEMVNLSKKMIDEIVEEEIDADIISSFTTNDTLNPNIWDSDETLKPEISIKLNQIANKFIEDIGLPTNAKVKDVILTGSIANYNWSKYSDIDLHVIIHFADIDQSTEFVKSFMDMKRAIWNDKHNIIIKGFEVETYIQDDVEKHIASGEYSLTNEEWIVKPTKEEHKIDFSLVDTKVDGLTGYVPILQKYMDEKKYQDVLDLISVLMKKIKKMRQAGLESAGEYSIENIAFKILRRSPFLDTLAKMKTEAYDKMMTVESSFKSKLK